MKRLKPRPVGHPITMRVNAEQLKLLSAASNRAGLPMASYARTAALREARRELGEAHG